MYKIKKTPSIAFVSDAVYPFSKGGKEKRLYDITQLLVERGYSVDIYTMKWWEGNDSIERDGVRFHALCRNYHLYVGKRRSIRQGFLFGLACLKLARVKFDIIDVDEIPFFPLYSVWIVCVIKRKKMIATWHEVWGRTYWYQYLGWRGIVASAIELLSVRLPSHIVAVSDSTARQLETLLHRKDNVSVINNGVNIAQLKRIRPSSEKYDIIFAARLLPHKHAELLLMAVAHLKHSHPKLTCLIIGTGPQEIYLKQLASQLDLGENVRFHDFYENIDDLYSRIKSAKVYVLPSDREGFGLGLLEANACGTPAVTVDAPANAARMLIQEGVNGTVAKQDVESLSNAIVYWLNHDSRKVSNAVVNYDWENVTSRLLKVYAL